MAQGQTFSFHTTHTTQLGKKQKLFYTTTPLFKDLLELCVLQQMNNTLTQ